MGSAKGGKGWHVPEGDAIFDPYITKWALQQDGEAIRSHSSRLLPVRYGGGAAMLKLPFETEEKFGGFLMLWWDGDGAARVLAHDRHVLLLERPAPGRSLADMAHRGGDEDDEATRILCATAARLHAPRPSPPPELIPLTRWFAELAPAAAKHGGVLRAAAANAHELLRAPQDVSVLHGDLHHGNVLDGGPRGWLAIDPKRLVGERGFDHANIICNPDITTSTVPERLARQVTVAADAALLDRTRLLRWVLAYAGLSAAWSLGDDNHEEAAHPLRVAEIAAAELAVVRA